MIDLEKQLNSAVRKYQQKNFKITQEVLQKEAEVVRQRMIVATVAIKSGKFKKSWKLKKYNNAIYVYNDRLGQNRIPLSNISEYSKTGPRPFIKRTWDSMKKDVERKVILNLKNRIK